MVNRRIVIGVMGSGGEEHVDLAESLGRYLAESGFDLLTGGGKGVMTSVSRSFAQTPGKRGIVMGVIPGHPQEDGRCETHPDYPNEWIELPIYTHLPDSGSRGWDVSSRNHINVLTSTVVVALPGNDGTKSEVHLAVQYGRPVIAFLGEGSIPDLPDEVSVAKSLDEVKAFIDSAIA